MKYLTAFMIFIASSIILITFYQVTKNTNLLFNNECNRLCLSDIEAGVTNREDAINILNHNNIFYTFEGYGGETIFIRSISLDFIDEELVNGFAQGNIHFDENNIVTLIYFELDVCHRVILSLYGDPMLWVDDDAFPATWVYPEHNLFFGIDVATLQIDGIFFHVDESMPTQADLSSWDTQSDMYSIGCSYALE